jgi:molybdopterin converting factor small subunit
MINLLYFMKLADTIGCKHEVLPMPERQSSICNILIILNKYREVYRQTLADTSKLQMTIKRKFVDISLAVMDADEIAFSLSAR